MRQFRGGQPSRNRAPGCGYAGIPPLPPLLKGGTTRNGIRTKTRLVQVEVFITLGAGRDYSQGGIDRIDQKASMNVKSTLQWATPYSLGLLLALALAALAGFALLRWASGRPIAPARRYGLLVLRLAILAILGLIMINPVRVDETPGAVERPKLFYLLDSSESMAIGKEMTRWDQVVQTIREGSRVRDPRAGAQVSLFRFGSHLAAVDADFWTAVGSQARFSKHARRRAGRRAVTPDRAAAGTDRFRHAPGCLARKSHGPVRPGSASGVGRLFRRPRPRPGSR